MKLIQEFTIYFLSFWFPLSFIPGIYNSWGTFINSVIASLGFVAVAYFMPYVLSFFKIDDKKMHLVIGAGITITSIYTYLLKPGIIGLLYFPNELIFGNEVQIFDFIRFDIGEFGIILFVGAVSFLLSLFLTTKFR